MRIPIEQRQAVAEEISGTTVGDKLLVTVWRDGELLADSIEILAWTLTWDAARSVQGQATLTLLDPDGTLTPWEFSDALAPGGSRLHLTYELGISGIQIPLGIWLIRGCEPRETWRLHRRGTEIWRLPGASIIEVTADEETAMLALDRLDPGLRVPKKKTALAEVAHLASDYLATTLTGVTDTKTLPASLVYDEERLDAIEDLLTIAGVTHRMTGHGVMELIPQTGTPSGWVLDGGEQGALIDTTRQLTDEGIYNAFVSSGSTAEQAPIIGRAYVTSGPLRRGGPFGTRTLFHHSIATTQAALNQDAATLRDNRQAIGEVPITVECLSHPGIQLHDQITIAMPTPGTTDHPILGRVSQMALQSVTANGGCVPSKRMTMTVIVSQNDLTALKNKARENGLG